MTSELGRRVGFTIAALLVYRLGTFVPIPGIDSTAWAALFRPQAGGLLATAAIFSGGGIRRMAVFALSVTPYLSAAILLQLLSIVVGPLRALARRGERGRRKLNYLTIGIAVVLALFQSLGLVSALADVPGIVREPGPIFNLTTVLTLTGGTVFLIWLCGQINTRGIGNGLALILFLGVVLEIPSGLAGMLELGRQGGISSEFIFGIIVLAAALTALIVCVEQARRRLSITYWNRQIGVQLAEGSAILPVKLNGAGVIPALLASWLLVGLAWFSDSLRGRGAPWDAIGNAFAHGRPLYLAFYAFAIILCVFFYTAIVLDPEEMAGDLDRRGGAIAGVEPGETTAAHLDEVISRTTMLGAVYLAFVCVVPEILISYARVPFYLGGTSLLLVVCTILDLDAQFQGGKFGGQYR